jgi:hypothetical protein
MVFASHQPGQTGPQSIETPTSHRLLDDSVAFPASMLE